LRIDLNADRRLLLAADADQAHSSNLYARRSSKLYNDLATKIVAKPAILSCGPSLAIGLRPAPVMSALVGGCYDLVPIPDPKLGPRKLEVATTYSSERYRPIYANKRGLPVFLNRSS
jgi:hypothetical protein